MIMDLIIGNKILNVIFAMSLVDQFYYFQKKSVWDLISGGISITIIEKIFELLERKMRGEFPIAMLGFSKSTNDQVVRFLRLIVEPAVVLTTLSSLQLLMFGDQGDYSGGVFLAGVAMAAMKDYYKTYKEFVFFWHRYLFNEISELEAPPRLSEELHEVASAMGGASGHVISEMGGNTF